jgi:hypothetical protein
MNLSRKNKLSDRFNCKPSQNKDFGSKSPAKTKRDKKAEPSFNPPRLLTGSSTRILKYVEDLKRGFNAEVGPKDYFEIASIINQVSHPQFSVTPIRCSKPKIFFKVTSYRWDEPSESAINFLYVLNGLLLDKIAI